MTKVDLQTRAIGVAQTQRFVDGLKFALDQRSAGGKVITGAEARGLIEQAGPLPPDYYRDLQDAVKYSLTAEDGWKCDGEARQAFADYLGVKVDTLPPAVELPPQQLTEQLRAQVQQIQSTLDNLQARAPELTQQGSHLLGKQQAAPPTSSYDGSKGGVLNMMSQQVPSKPAAAAGGESWDDPVQWINSVYGPGAASQASQLELMALQIEFALVAALLGANEQQIMGMLGVDSPAARALCKDIMQLSHMLTTQPMDPAAIEQHMARGEKNFYDYAAQRGSMQASQINLPPEGHRPQRPSGAGGAGGAGGAQDFVNSSLAHGTAQSFVGQALAQQGDRYIYGAETNLNDADPDTFDCSELVQWAAARSGVTVPDGSANQLAHCRKNGTEISVEQAMRTPGALLFRKGHVAISLGNGKTIEAKGRKYGVGVFNASGRFTSGGLIPGMKY